MITRAPAGSVDRAATARRAARLFAPYGGRVAIVLVTIVLSSGLGVVSPFVVEAIFDRALFVPGGPDLDLLYVLVGVLIGVPVVSAAIGVGQTYLTNVLGNRVMQDLRDRLFTHLQRMDLAFFTTTRTGEIQSRLGNDVGGVQGVVTETASTILGNVIMVLSSLIAMVVLSWQLTLVSVGLLPLFIWLNIRVGRRRRAVATDTQASMADMTAITQESLSVSGVLLTKVFNRQGLEAERYRAENARQAGLQVRQAMTGQSFWATVQTFLGVTPALIYLVAGLALAAGSQSLTAGTVVAFTTLQTRVLFPTMRLLQVGVQVQTSLALFARIFEYLDLQPGIVDAADAVDLRGESVRGHIAFRGVSFRYPGVASLAGTDAEDVLIRRWVLDGIDLEIRPGQLAAVVGPSGAGKTTLSYLVPRLYDATRGRVEIDGHDVRRVTLSSLADLVGMVTQETYLFHASVRQNLRYAKADATDAELEDAARAAAIHDRILELDNGYDTVVGERGYRLSGGEQQRLAIARVLLADPRILILDEATSALDTRNERLVQQALEPLMAGRTTVAIAHRLSTILAADVVFVLDAGRLVEQGTHDELLARGGLYARLYAEQFGGGRIQARCSDGVVLGSGEVVPAGAG